MEREKSCGTIVFRCQNSSKMFLLLHHASGHWDLPKGHVEKGETEEATALRELKEETGISNARLVPGFREKITYYYKRNSETFFKQVRFFLVETKQKEVRVSSEHKGFQWLPFKEAVKKLTFKNAREILKKARDFLKQSTLTYSTQ